MVEQSQNPVDDPGAQRRRSTRIVQAIPLTVIGEDALGQPFRERTSTLIVNCHGCRYQSKHYVPKNAFINIEIPNPDPAREPRRVRARVTWIQRPRTVRELFQVGAELEVQGNCWGVAFPPDDWFPWPEQEGPEIPGLAAEIEEKSATALPAARHSAARVPATPMPAPAMPAAATPSAPMAATPPVLHEEEDVTHAATAPAAGGQGTVSADKVRVMTRPSAGAEVSAALARQMARLMVDAKQQIAQAVRLAATQVITAETKQVMGDLTTQLRTAAERAVEEAAAARAEKDAERGAAQTLEALRITLGRIEESREAGVRAVAEQGRAEAERSAEVLVRTEEALRQTLGRIEESREASVRAVAEQGRAEAERSTEAVARTEEALRQTLGRIEESREAGLRSVAEQARKEIERTVQAGARTEQGLQQTLQRIEESREAGLRAVTEQARVEVQRVAEMAVAELSGRIAATGAELREHAAREVEAGRSQIAALEAELAGAISGAGQRCQTDLDSRIQTARQSLEELASEAGQVEGKIAEAVERNRAEWREKLEGDIAVVGSEWNELVATSIRTSTEGLAARLTEQAQGAVSEAQRTFTTQVETQLAAARAALDALQAEAGQAMGAIQHTTAETNASAERVMAELRKETDAAAATARETFEALRQAFDSSAAEARRNVDALRESLDTDAKRAEAIMAEIQEAAMRVQDYSAQLEQLSRSTAEELQRRFESVLAAQSEQLNQRAEHIVDEMAGRLVPTFEEAGQRSVEKFLQEMEEHLQQTLTPQFERVSDVLGRLAAGQEQAEAALRSVRERLRDAADQYVREAVSRMQTTITQLEHDYQESSRQALARLTAELDEKATETTHTTFEGLLKASDWYQKKAQTSMQSALERAVEQASTTLREKAGEMSSLFATELDHYSRSYTEHTEGLLDETSKKIVEGTRSRLDEAAATTLAGLGDQALRVAEQELKNLEAAGELTAQKLFANMEARERQTEMRADESIGRVDAGAKATESRIEARAGETEKRVGESLGRMDARAGEVGTRAGESLRRIAKSSEETEAGLARTLAALESAAGEVRAADEAAMRAARERMAQESEESFGDFQARVAERMVQGVTQAQQDLQVSLQPIIESWRAERESQHREWITALQQLGAEALDQHQNRLANVSNSWMATSVTTLSEHSQNVLDQLAHAAEQRLRETCAQVFSGLGDTLRQRMLGLSADLAPKVPPIIPPQNPEKKK